MNTVCGGTLTTPNTVPVSRAGISICLSLADRRLMPLGSSNEAASFALPHWLMSANCALKSKPQASSARIQRDIN